METRNGENLKRRRVLSRGCQVKRENFLSKRKIRITVETDSFLLVRRGSSSLAWSEKSADFSEYASVEVAIVLASADTDTLTQRVRADRLHLTKATDESALVCLRSILKHIKRALGVV